MVVGGAAYARGRNRGQQDAQAEDYPPEPEQQVQYAPPAPPPPAPTNGPSDLDQLKGLAELHDSGALTDDEFAAEKAKILGG
ncbi:MAG TPA: SHOCT domain-containing protein [Actinomycetes bacterium]